MRIPVIEYVIIYRDGRVKTITLSSGSTEGYDDIASGFAYDEIAAVHRRGEVEVNA